MQVVVTCVTKARYCTCNIHKVEGQKSHWSILVSCNCWWISKKLQKKWLCYWNSQLLYFGEVFVVLYMHPVLCWFMATHKDRYTVYIHLWNNSKAIGGLRKEKKLTVPLTGVWLYVLPYLIPPQGVSQYDRNIKYIKLTWGQVLANKKLAPPMLWGKGQWT